MYGSRSFHATPFAPNLHFVSPPPLVLLPFAPLLITLLRVLKLWVNMHVNKLPFPLLLLLLLQLIIISSIPQKPSITEARPLSLKPHQGSSSFLASIGVVCKCCDGVDGACASTWTGSCSDLQCSPWKLSH